MRLELWINAENRVRWRNPTHPYAQPPPADYDHVADFPVDLWGEGITGNFRRLPGGALLGKPREQVFGMGGPRLLYLDERRECRDCRGGFVFGALEQQHWYEVRKLWNEVEAHRCPACRKEWRDERAGQKRLMEAHAALKREQTPAAHLELAAASLAHATHLGRAPLERALSSARKAQASRALAEDAAALETQLRARLDDLANRARWPR